MSAFLKFDNISFAYDHIQALRHLSGSLKENNLYGFIGPDGAGKSTLFQMITGLQTPQEGQLTFRDPDARSPGQIGYMPQQFSMYPDLTVRENLLFFADLYNIRGELRQTRYDQLLQFSKLDRFTKRRAADLSGGMKQKLALICVLMYSPPLLILDEPTTGVDPMARSELWDMLHQLRDDGHTILVSTPYMEEAVLCDQVFFLSHGAVLAVNSPGDFIANYPNQLFRLDLPNIMETLPKLESVDWIATVYPKGNRIHLSLLMDGPSNTELESRLRQIVGDNFSLRRIQPGMEDVYASLEYQQ